MQPADAIVLPTAASITNAKSTAAAPKSIMDSGLPAETSASVISKPESQAEQSGHRTSPAPIALNSKAGEPTNVSGDASRAENTKASPLDSNHDPIAGPDSTRPKASSADIVQGLGATRSRANTQLDSSKGVAAILSMLLAGGSQGPDTKGVPNITPTSASIGDVMTVNGNVLTIGSAAINVGDTTVPLRVEPPASKGGDIIIAGKTMAALKDGHEVIVDGTKLTLGQVTTLVATQISVVSDGVVVGTSTASFHELGGSTTGSDDAVTIDGTVYSASTLPGHSYAIRLAGLTLSRGGPAVNIDNEVVTYGSRGLSVISSTGIATATPTHDPADSVVTIGGTAYTAEPVQGRSGVVVLGGQTLSIGGSKVDIASHFVTKGPSGISLFDEIVSSSDVADRSLPTSTTDVTESYTFAVKQSSAASNEKSSSSSAKISPKSYLLRLMIATTMCVAVKL